MVSFGAAGCGDDDNQVQQDAGQKDANVQEDAKIQDDVAVKQDAPVGDAPVQDDAAPGQADAANTSGTVIVVQVRPQPTGNAQMDAVKLASVSASWDALIPPGDNPTAMVDLRNAAGLGCYAKYYRFTNGISDAGTPIYNMNDAGVTMPVDDTANAGNVTVTGYTGGSYIVGMDADSGMPITSPINSTSTCTREEIMGPGDAGTGRYEYNCDVLSAPVTGFLVPGTDKLTINAAGGGTEIGAFSATNVDVAPFMEVTQAGMLWAITNPAFHSDAGVTIPYKCGETDAGPTACNAVLGLQIQWTDAVTPMDGLMPEKPINEMGKIVCSKIGAGSAYTIPAEVWATAFPAGNNAKSILSYLTHMTMTTKHGMSTLIGVGGGQIGLTHQ